MRARRANDAAERLGRAELARRGLCMLLVAALVVPGLPARRPADAAEPTVKARRVRQAAMQAPVVPPEEPLPGEPPPRFALPPMRFEDLPPPPPSQVRIPLSGAELSERLQIKQAGGLITLVVRDVPLGQVLTALGEKQGLNFVLSDNLSVPISVSLEKVELEDALTAIVSVAGYTWTRHKDIIHVTAMAGGSRVAPHVQDRQVMIFPLDYVAAQEVELAVRGLLSPVGRSFLSQRQTTDNRRTQETLVVEDMPAYLNRIAEYVEQIDQPPRQVMIEAHVLAVTLKTDDRHGVNFEHFFNPGGRDFNLEAQGFATPTAPQAFFFNVNSGEMNFLLECLRTQTDSKTLASPKVLVLNNQEARLQVGKQLGFRVLTTTQTSTLESVNFLDVGVVLRVTPRITRDGQVIMFVKPEVSSGLVNPDTGLPEEETTEVETNVLLPDGRGVVIGGLIQEKDSDTQNKLPLLGDVWLIGKLFQRKAVAKERVEIIIALMPRIAPLEFPCTGPHAEEVEQARTPLFRGPLEPTHRPWEPALLDTMENPYRLKNKHHHHHHRTRRTNQLAADCPTCYEADPYYDGAWSGVATVSDADVPEFTQTSPAAAGGGPPPEAIESGTVRRRGQSPMLYLPPRAPAPTNNDGYPGARAGRKQTLLEDPPPRYAVKSNDSKKPRSTAWARPFSLRVSTRR